MKWVKRLGIGFGSIAALLVVWAGAGALIYSPEYVSRVLTSRVSSVDDYLKEDWDVELSRYERGG